jgi:mRNA interferase HigB
VHVISEKTLRTFWKKHPDAKIPLKKWHSVMSGNRFLNPEAMLKEFGNRNVDKVSDKLYWFDIGGNNYRLLASILFNQGRVYIRKVLTHAEYDKENKGGN